ncbi:hypothetical protein [Aquimarina rhabdastrellae]
MIKAIDFNNIEKLKKLGFEGFVEVFELINNIGVIPEKMGVYLVLNINNNKPEFLIEGVGGFFKERNPNVSLDILNENWVDDVKTIYIGKAGSLKNKSTLKSRIKQYLKFGKGKAVGHYGGRFIWQLKNYSDLVFCWLAISDFEPREYEKLMIKEFIQQYGKRPFANLKG